MASRQIMVWILKDMTDTNGQKKTHSTRTSQKSFIILSIIIFENKWTWKTERIEAWHICDACKCYCKFILSSLILRYIQSLFDSLRLFINQTFFGSLVVHILLYTLTGVHSILDLNRSAKRISTRTNKTCTRFAVFRIVFDVSAAAASVSTWTDFFLDGPFLRQTKLFPYLVFICCMHSIYQILPYTMIRRPHRTLKNCLLAVICSMWHILRICALSKWCKKKLYFSFHMNEHCDPHRWMMVICSLLLSC